MAILACTSFDALLSLSSSQPHLLGMNQLQTIIARLKMLTTGVIRAKKSHLAAPVAALSLHDPRFLALLQRTRQLCQPQGKHDYLQTKLLRDLSKVLLVASMSPDGSFPPRTPVTQTAAVEGFAVSGAAQLWPPEVLLVLVALLEHLQHYKRVIDSRNARRLVQSVSSLLSLGFVHALFPALVGGALRVLAKQLPSMNWTGTVEAVPRKEAVLEEMISLALLAREVLQVAEVAHLSYVAPVTAAVMRRLCSLSEDDLTQVLQRASGHVAEALFRLSGVRQAYISWQQWEVLCSSSARALANHWNAGSTIGVIDALAHESYYHEPLMLASAAQVLRLHSQHDALTISHIRKHGSSLLLSFATLRVHPQHPLTLSLFAAVLSELKVESMPWHEAVRLLWSVVVMRYHHAGVEAEVVAAWKGCNAATTGVLMPRERDMGTPKREDKAMVRQEVVAKRRARVMQAMEEAMAALHRASHLAADGLSEAEWSRAVWMLAELQAALSTHRRLQPTAWHLPPLSSQLQQAVDEHVAQRLSQRPRSAFTRALLARLAQLGYSSVDPSSIPTSLPYVHQPLCVGVPYPTPASPSGRLLLLIDTNSIRPVTRQDQEPHAVGFAALRLRWLQGSGWPFLSVDYGRWKQQLMGVPNSEQLAILDRQVKQAVQEWEQRMAWPGWGDVCASMEMEQPRQAYHLYRERQSELTAQAPPSPAADAARVA